MKAANAEESRNSSVSSYEEVKLSSTTLCEDFSPVSSAIVALDKSNLHWSELQFKPSKSTEMSQPMPKFVFEDAGFNPREPFRNGRKVINLALGDPKKEDGYFLPPKLNKAVIETIEKGTYNGYTYHKGAIEARKAIVDK